MIEIKINKRMANHAVGDIVIIPDDGGVPLNAFWRRRLEDAESDGCCEIVTPVESKPLGTRMPVPETTDEGDE